MVSAVAVTVTVCGGGTAGTLFVSLRTTTATGAVVAAYLHVVGYKNFDAALKEIAALRPFIAPWATLIASVREHLQ
jgi:hypothetical protein